MGLRRLRKRLLGLGRLLVAVALLAALWLVTVNQVGNANHSADNQRVRDREVVAKAVTVAVNDTFDTGRSEAALLAGTVNATGPQAAVTAYMEGPQRFKGQALVIDRSFRTVGTPNLVLRGVQVPPCMLNDPAFRDLMAAAATAPVMSRVMTGPACSPIIAAAAPAGALVAMIVTDLSQLQQRIGALGSALASRVLLVDSGHVEVTAIAPPAPATPDVASFIAQAGPSSVRTGRGHTPGSDQQIVSAIAPVSDGWVVDVQQDAAVFSSGVPNKPKILVGTLLTGAFAAVLLLLALFDLRRQRAHQRSEVAKHAFFSIVGHELRTPLTVLKGFTETLSDRWDALDENRRRLMIDNLSPQVLRLNRVVDRLLLASAIQSETNAHPVVRPVPLEEHLQRVVRQFRPVAPLHTFVVDVAPDVPEVLADPAALDQVLDQLVDNAVRYSPAGGTVELTARPSRGGVAIDIDDEGVGLPSDYRRVFEAFVQGEAVDRRVHDEGGVGVGLFIARSLLKQMGGRVDAIPREKGARFVVRLRTVRANARVTSPSVPRP